VTVQDLPELPAAADAAGKALSVLLRKVPDAAHPLAQDCFRLMGGECSSCSAQQSLADMEEHVGKHHVGKLYGTRGEKGVQHNGHVSMHSWDMHAWPVRVCTRT
jgi:hypothetical protein